MSKLRTYWGRTHAQAKQKGSLESEGYSLAWSKLVPLHASSEREAREVLAAKVGDQAQRAQVFMPSGAGGLGVLTWDGPASALAPKRATWSGTLAEFRALDLSALEGGAQ